MRIVNVTLRQKVTIKRDLDIVEDKMLIDIITNMKTPIENEIMKVEQEVIEAHVEHTDEEPEKVEVSDEERLGLQMILQVLGQK